MPHDISLTASLLDGGAGHEQSTDGNQARVRLVRVRFLLTNGFHQM